MRRIERAVPESGADGGPVLWGGATARASCARCGGCGGCEAHAITSAAGSAARMLILLRLQCASALVMANHLSKRLANRQMHVRGPFRRSNCADRA